MRISTSTKIGIGIGFIGAIAISILFVFTILRSTSSTAAIGFVFIPVCFVIAFVGFFIWGYSLGYIKTWFANVARIFNFKIILAFIVSAGFAVLLFGGLGEGLLLTSAVSQVQKMNTNQELQNVFDTSYFKSSKFVLGAIAQNPAASAELLDRIAKLSDPSLHDTLSDNVISLLFPVLGDDGKGLAVMRRVVNNPNISASTIEYLANTSQVDYVLGDIAGNPKTSIKTLRRLEIKKNYLIDWGLAYNKNTPEDVFLKLLERKDDFAHAQQYTLRSISENQSASAEIRAKASELLRKY